MRIRALACALVTAACSTAPAPRPGVATVAHPASLGRRAFRVEGMARPTEVLYDEFHDRYLVANSNGPAPGFISTVTPDGRIITLRWIEGDRDGVTLRDPHGMGILGGILYVADVASVRTFYLNDGRSAGDLEIMTATSLRDVAVDAVAGKVYVADCGMLPAADGSSQPTGGGAIWVVEKKTPRLLVAGGELHNPNGIATDGSGGLWVVGGDGGVYRLDGEGGKHDGAGGPGRALDGVALFGERVFVSDAGSNAVYERRGDGFVPVITGVARPAGIAIDARRRRLLVPSGDGLEAYDL